MPKKNALIYVGMALGLVGIILIAAMPYVIMEGVGAFTFFGLLGGSGVFDMILMVLVLLAPIAMIVMAWLNKKLWSLIPLAVGVIFLWIAYARQVGPWPKVTEAVRKEAYALLEKAKNK